MTRGWWRRNAIPLGVIAVLAPVTAAAVSLTAWQDLTSVRRVVVAEGDTAAYGRAEVGIASAHFDEVGGIPHGARVVAVEIDIDPGGTAFPCSAPLLYEATGAHRQWQDSTMSLDRPYDPDRVTYCDGSRTDPYTLSLDYLVPEDATGPFELEVSSTDGLPERLRLQIAP